MLTAYFWVLTILCKVSAEIEKSRERITRNTANLFRKGQTNATVQNHKQTSFCTRTCSDTSVPWWMGCCFPLLTANGTLPSHSHTFEDLQTLFHKKIWPKSLLGQQRKSYSLSAPEKWWERVKTLSHPSLCNGNFQSWCWGNWGWRTQGTQPVIDTMDWEIPEQSPGSSARALTGRPANDAVSYADLLATLFLSFWMQLSPQPQCN